MIDIKFLRENPDAVKENIKKKFQEHKLPLVDEVIELDAQSRAAKQQADDLRANRNKISKEIGKLMAQGKREEGMALKEEVNRQAKQLSELEAQEAELSAKVTEIIDTENASGAVYADGKTWTARSVDDTVIPAGSRVRVEAMQGVKLLVKPVEK